MYSATWNVYWGTRFQGETVTLYFSRKPSNKEIFDAFRDRGHRLYEKFYLSACSGMITVKKIEVVF